MHSLAARCRHIFTSHRQHPPKQRTPAGVIPQAAALHPSSKKKNLLVIPPTSLHPSLPQRGPSVVLVLIQISPALTLTCIIHLAPCSLLPLQQQECVARCQPPSLIFVRAWLRRRWLPGQILPQVSPQVRSLNDTVTLVALSGAGPCNGALERNWHC